MEKTIGAFEARRQFGKIIHEVVANGDKYVVERHGEPVVAVVPMRVYEQWKQQRDAFFQHAQETAERSNLSPEEADRLAQEAVAAVRATTP